MKVLVTGGTGIVGRATVTELVRRGHQVRLLSRGAERDAATWEHGVEPFPGDVADPARIDGAALGCDAVIHIAGVVEESRPDGTFERINVGGTTNVLRAAEAAGVQRFVFVSSLGASRGQSDYHRSKVRAEQLVEASGGDWTIVRIAPVVGPRDETVSVLLRMVRTLPFTPIIDAGDQPFQPVWHEDVGWGLAECVERDDVAHELLRLAGAEIVTVREVLELFEKVTDRAPVHIPLPSLVARIGTSLADAIGVRGPVSAATVQMLLEGSFLREGERNDLTERFARALSPIRDRLVQLVDAQPEQTPDSGVGKLRRRRFTVDIVETPISATELLERFRLQFASLVPFEAAAEPGSPERLEDGATLTLDLSLRGHAQMRVERIDDNTITMATVAGHPLAGVLRFGFRNRDDGIRFTIDVIARPASRADQISMAVVGARAQRRTWIETAHNVVRAAAGRAAGDVEEESWHVDDDDAEPLESWVHQLIHDREQRQEHRVEFDYPDPSRA